MNISGNTILITGGGSGIGRALAEAFHAKGNQVIVAGRRPGALDETTAVNPGMRSAVLDIEDRDAIPAFAARIAAEFPTLNVLVNNAGIMRRETLTASPVDLATAEATVATNLLGPIRLTAAFLPHLRRQPGATVLMVSSGLAFVPIAITPTYCATKANCIWVDRDRHPTPGLDPGKSKTRASTIPGSPRRYSPQKRALSPFPLKLRSIPIRSLCGGSFATATSRCSNLRRPMFRPN